MSNLVAWASLSSGSVSILGVGLGIGRMYFCRMILVSLLFSLGRAYECPGPASVAISVKNSTAVFSGEVKSEEYRDVKEDSMGEPREAKALVVKLKVNRWWKGNGTDEVELYTSLSAWSIESCVATAR